MFSLLQVFKNLPLSRIMIILILGLNVTCYAAKETNAVDILIANTVAPTPILEDLRHLADNIGGRPTGSPAMEKAMQWGLKQFIAAGFKEAHLQPYTAPRNWLPNIEQGEFTIINPATKNQSPQSIRLAAMPMTISTPTSGLKAPVYVLSSADVNTIKANASQIKGHWLLIPNKPMLSLEDMFNEYLITPPLFSAAIDAGAVGILWQSNRQGRIVYRHSPSIAGYIIPLPAALIEREASEKIVRAFKEGEAVQFNANLQNIVQESPRNYNVVAEIKGSEKPNEVIILGAHLDSWDLGQGALDNGCNVSLVIDAARQMFALQKHGIRPKRTIRFILYSGEELGLYGSLYDVKEHSDTLNSIKAVIIYDLGTGRTTGFSLGGRPEMISLINEALQPIKNLGPFTQTTDAFIGTDNFDYLLHGIPTLVANQESASYLPPYHAESDTLDKVDARELKLNTLIATVLTWNLANTQTSFPPRQNKQETAQLLESTGLKKQMEIYNMWNDFQEDKR